MESVNHPSAPSSTQPDLTADVVRLQTNFPLLSRRRDLPPETRQAHSRLLEAIVSEGRLPVDLDPSAVSALAAVDVIVADESGVVGAYPFSLIPTAHRVTIDGTIEVNAMCAIDAVAIAPVWGLPTRTDSQCAVTGVPIRIDQGHDGAVSEPAGVRLGIRWQVPQGSASTSMCREMVFLSDAAVARGWQGVGGDASVYTLEEGIEFGRRFFAPLRAD